jgi:hypothetical protein
LGVRHMPNPSHLHYLLKYEVVERLGIHLTPFTSISF